MFVLDQSLRLVPAGVPGDLYIAGAGLARGYLGRPDLTAAHFVPNPFGAPGERMYKTGDLGRYRDDGTLEFLGRNDGQVKLRGFRIELGEIENVLRQHPHVDDALVALVRTPSGQSVLRAFVAAPSAAAPTADDLRGFLVKGLPDYMLPSNYVVLPQLPLTTNGKIDRAALVALEPLAQIADGSEDPPYDGVEAQLVEIWEEILAVRPRRNDDFFELGGTSISALRLVSSVARRFDRPIRLADVFTARTVAALAVRIRGDVSDVVQPSPLVLLAPPVAGERPIFCVHPVGGSVDVYRDLGRLVGRRRGCYGLQAVGTQRDLVAMARRYLEEVRRVQPVGPYLLCGWSLGGAVAFEMARQLRSEGEVVDKLVLVDPANLHGTDAAGAGALLTELAWTMGLQSSALGAAVDDGEAVDDSSEAVRARLRTLAATARDAGLIARDVSDDDLWQRFEVFAANRQALHGYAGGHYEDGAVLVWAQDRPEADRQAWRAAVAHHEEEVLAGDHYQVIALPLVTAVAALFDRAAGGRRSPRPAADAAE
jgi:thioesterase domain-containing protein/acyl carrier protein